MIALLCNVLTLIFIIYLSDKKHTIFCMFLAWLNLLSSAYIILDVCPKEKLSIINEQSVKNENRRSV